MSASQKLRFLFQVLRKNNSTAEGGLPKMWHYMKVEMRPPTQAEWPEVQKGFNNLIQAFKTQKWRQLTVKESTINALIAVEVGMWFIAGECIGRRRLLGYYVPPVVVERAL